MATCELKQNIARTTAFAILPMLLLFKTITVMLGGPTSAKATIQPMLVISPTGAGGPGVTWTDQQRAAAGHIEFLKDQPFDPSPLHRAALPISPFQTPGAAVPELPQITVRIIMSSEAEVVALINDRRCVVGDTLEETGWVIVEIDADALAVTLKHARTSQLVVVSVQTPG